MCNHHSHNMCGGGGCCGEQVEWSEKDKLTYLEHKEKMLETKLEFIRKAKESLKPDKISAKK